MAPTPQLAPKILHHLEQAGELGLTRDEIAVKTNTYSTYLSTVLRQLEKKGQLYIERGKYYFKTTTERQSYSIEYSNTDFIKTIFCKQFPANNLDSIRKVMDILEPAYLLAKNTLGELNYTGEPVEPTDETKAQLKKAAEYLASHNSNQTQEEPE